jgi:hypothetical protein
VQPHASRRSGPLTWLAAWLIFSVLGGMWALGSPILSVPDEPAHAVYAAAVVRGQIWAPAEGHVTTVTVPRDFENIDNAPTCYAFQPNVPAGCAEALTDKEGEVEIGTRAGRYLPAYYLYAGLGSLVADGANAIYAMRLLTVFAVAACLASAACSVLSRRRPTIGLVGLGLAATPMLFFFAASVNPQAPEIAVAILLWTSGSALLLNMRDDPDLPLTLANADLRRVLIALVLLPLIRSLAFVWLGIIVGALLLAFASWPAIRRLLRARVVLATIPLFVLSLGVVAVWILVRNTLALGEPLETTYAALPGDQALFASATKLNNEYLEMIGVFGWLTTPAPGLVYVLYTVLLGGLVALTVFTSPVRQNVTLALLALTVAVVPVLLEVQSYEASGFAWQGRYTLPIAVGVPLLLGMSDGGTRLAGPVARRFLLTAMAGLVVVHVVSFGGALSRHVFGINGFWGLSPAGWDPPVPALALLAGVLVVTVAGAWLAATRGPVPDGPDGPDGAPAEQPQHRGTDVEDRTGATRLPSGARPLEPHPR